MRPKLPLAPHIAVFGAGATALALALVYPVIAGGIAETGPLHVSVSATPNSYAIEGQTSVAASKGVYGYALGSSGIGAEGYSATASGLGYGLYGHAQSGDGVFGVSGSAAYASIYGTNATAGGTGVFGNGRGMGVYGTSADGDGVVGQTASEPSKTTSFSAILGQDQAKLNGLFDNVDIQNYGVYGSSTNYIGVGATGPQIGVYAESASLGVLGTTTGSYSTGIRGNSDGTGGIGVEGTQGGEVSSGAAGVVGSSYQNPGVHGLTFRGVGVLGSSSEGDGLSGTTDTGSGVTGASGTSSSASTGVTAVANGSGSTALQVSALKGQPIIVTSGNPATQIMTLDASGNLTISGTLTQSASPAAAHTAQRVDSETVSRGGRATVEDVGEGRMVAGRAYVELDPSFARSLDTSAPYFVFVTPDAPAERPLYVSEKTLRGFSVREPAGNVAMTFDYRVVGHPRGSTTPAQSLPYRDAMQSVTLVAPYRRSLAHPLPKAKIGARPTAAGTLPREAAIPMDRPALR